MIAGPLIAAPMIENLPEIPFKLMQPTSFDNNDTLGESETGTAVSGGAEETDEAAERLRMMARMFKI